MKYLKLFVENIDFDDFDWIEEEPNDIKKGDFVIPKDKQSFRLYDDDGNLSDDKYDLGYLVPKLRRDPSKVTNIIITKNGETIIRILGYGNIYNIDDFELYKKTNESIDFDEDDFEWMDEEPNFNYGYWGNNENWYDSIYVITDGDKIFKNYHLTNGSLPNISKLDKSQLKELKDNNYSIAVYMGNKQKDNWIYMRYKDLVKKYPEFNIDNL